MLATKKNKLSVSVVAGSSLWASQILKSSDLSTSDSGRSFNVSILGKQDALINTTGAGEGERIEP